MCKDPEILLLNMTGLKQSALLRPSAAAWQRRCAKTTAVLWEIPAVDVDVLPSAMWKCVTFQASCVRAKASTSLPALYIARGRVSRLPVLGDAMPVVVPAQPWKQYTGRSPQFTHENAFSLSHISFAGQVI